MNLYLLFKRQCFTPEPPKNSNLFMSTKVYIILVNYNGWEDTIECLESILKNEYEDFQIVVVDNNSPNDSLLRLKQWAQGNFVIDSPKNELLKSLSYPFAQKPIRSIWYSKTEAENGGIENETILSNHLVFVDAGENNGFAGGNNIGIKYALKKNDAKYIWLLNNDTVIEKDALDYLVNSISSNDQVAAVGSKLLYYDEPALIQSLGSQIDSKSIYKLNKPIINTSKKNFDSDDLLDEIEVNDIMGASLLVKRAIIEECGLIPEAYFLYGEETDWNFSFQNRGYKLLTIPKSRVYHKENRSTGGSGNPTMLYYKTRNQFLLNNKYKNIFFFHTKLYFFQYVIRKFFRAIFSDSKVRRAILKGLKDGLNQVNGKIDI